MAPIDWLEIPAPDPHALAAFYREVFGWTIVEDPDWPDFPMFRSGGEGSLEGGFNASWAPSSEPGFLPHITVEDIDAALDRVEAQGGERVRGRTAISDTVGAYATFRDPAGNVMGLFEAPRKDR